MDRYSLINNKNKREIVLLKSRPCAWGKCTFCDYIEDNEVDNQYINEFNEGILNKVTGIYGRLEVINSGNVFELPKETLEKIKEIVTELNITEIYFEAHWIYKNRLKEIRDQFKIPVVFKTGLESFNQSFREDVLHKGFTYEDIDELKEYFDSVCLMVGIIGQTKEMIKRDIELAMEHFNHFTVNVYCENTTNIKPDEDLKKWFTDHYQWLNDEKKCDVLWENTDFGVGD
jgi:hypothetical protein